MSSLTHSMGRKQSVPMKAVYSMGPSGSFMEADRLAAMRLWNGMSDSTPGSCRILERWLKRTDDGTLAP